MRIKRIGLEDHGDAALGRRQPGHVASADGDSAVGEGFKPGDHAQQGRLAAAGRADEDAEFAIGNIEVDAADDGDVAKGFLDATKD